MLFTIGEEPGIEKEYYLNADYRVSYDFIAPLPFSGNQDDHQNFNPSLLPYINDD